MKTESLIGKAHNLQSPSPTIVKLLNLISDPDADFGEAIATIEHDSVLSAKLLALCSTARYGLAQPLGSVKQCVLYLGYTEIHRLILSLGFGHQLGGSLPAYDMEAGALWQHSLTTAILTPRILSVSSDAETDTSTAYTAGLLHDIGKLVITQLLSTNIKKVIYALVEEDGKTLIEAETATLGSNHAQIGAELLATWRLPDSIVTAVRHHHDPGKASNSKLAAAVYVANTIAHQVASPANASKRPFTFDETALTVLRLRADDLEKLAALAGVIEAGVAAENSGQGTTAGTGGGPLSF